MFTRYSSRYHPFKQFKAGLINLRAELKKLFEIDKTAHWVILRQFDKTKKTEHWNELTQEAVGGPAWEYSDQLILARKSSGRQVFFPGSQEAFIPMGLMDNTGYRFYLTSDIIPHLDDVIYEIEYQGNKKPTIIDLPFVAKWNIITIVPMRDQEYGRIEYFICFVESEKHK